MKVWLQKYQVKIIEKTMVNKVRKYIKEVNKIVPEKEYRRSFFYEKLTGYLDILNTLDSYVPIPSDCKEDVNKAHKLMESKPVAKSTDEW